MSFLDMAQDLMRDEATKAAYEADPDGFLAARGFDGLSPADVAEAVGFVADTLSAEAAARVAEAGPDPAKTDLGGLGRLAGLEPAALDPDAASEAEPDLARAGLWEHDPSGEIDLPPVDDPDGDDAASDPASTSDGDDAAASPFARLETPEPDPGFGVGWEPGDADDVTAASPEFAHLTDHPLDTDLDATHVADLALESGDPIGEAIHWADQEAAPEHADPLGSELDPPEHTGDDAHDGDHLDL